MGEALPVFAAPPAKDFLRRGGGSENSRLRGARDRRGRTNAKPRTGLVICQPFCVAESTGRVDERGIIY